MCERCRNTPIDPDDAEYVEAEIASVIFDAPGMPFPDMIVLMVETEEVCGALLCPPVIPVPMPGERVRVYGVIDPTDSDGQTVRGLIIGMGEGETPRVAYYRTAAHEAELTEHAEAVIKALAALDTLIADARKDPHADPDELAEMLTMRERARKRYGVDDDFGILRIPSPPRGA